MNRTSVSAADRAALENLWGDAGIWAADTWTELNRTCFDGELRYRGVVWGLTPHGSHLGHTHGSSGRITLHPALLDPQGDAWLMEARLGARFARDVLVHEMVHAFLVQQGRESAHNSEPWCAEIMRITPLLDLAPIRAEPVKQRRIDHKVTRRARDGFLERAAIASWPHSLRPARYYEGSNGRIHVPI